MGAQHSGPRRCNLNDLAADEVHSVMQLLDQTSLLRLARCSRRMKSDADSDAAWRMQPPFELRLEQGSVTEIVARLRRSLLSHVSATRIHLSGRRLVEADLDAMLTLPRITEINDAYGFILSGEWPRILRHPAVAGLTTLVTQANVPPDIIRQLAHLPRLDTLELRSSMFPSALRSLQSLTYLAVGTLDAITKPSLLTAIAACTQLKRLRLGSAELHEGEFRRLFTSPHLSRLEHLELEEMAGSTSQDEFADAFAAMTQLRHINLGMVRGIDDVLSAASRVPHLVTISMTRTHRGPSAAAVRTLLAETEATSRAQVTLRLPRGIDSTPFAALGSRRFTLISNV